MNPRYGGFWRRAIANIIDQLIIFGVYMILIIIEFVFFSPRFPYGLLREIALPFLGSHLILGMIISAVYFTWFHAKTGQTPGKMLLRLQVISVRGRSLSFFRSFARYLGFFLSSVCLFLGFVWVAFDSRKQGWHDKIAGTVVIVVGKSIAEPRPLFF